MKKLVDRLFHIMIFIGTGVVVLLMLAMLAHIVKESIPAFCDQGFALFSPGGGWRPVSSTPRYSLLPAIAGTLYVSALAVIFSLVLGLGTALLLNFYLPEKTARMISALIDLVAGIPSVIFGFIGLTVVVKNFQTCFGMAAGQCVMAGGMVLGVMLLPFVVSTCSESIEVARKRYEATALALGFSKEMMIIRIILPSIKTGIMAAVMMALGRGLGETMGVMMVIGNSAIYPKLFGRAQTIASLTALEMGSIEYGSIHLSVLYVANLVLLAILFFVPGIGKLLKWRAKKYE